MDLYNLFYFMLRHQWHHFGQVITTQIMPLWAQRTMFKNRGILGSVALWILYCTILR